MHYSGSGINGVRYCIGVDNFIAAFWREGVDVLKP